MGTQGAPNTALLPRRCPRREARECPQPGVRREGTADQQSPPKPSDGQTFCRPCPKAMEQLHGRVFLFGD